MLDFGQFSGNNPSGGFIQVEPPKRLRFGAFELDLKAGELRQGGDRMRLQEQPLQVLLMLIEHQGQVVTAQELKKKLWPHDTAVEFEQSIHTAIRRLRRALGDSAEEPKYIETVGRRGYRLMIQVERCSPDIDHSALAQPPLTPGDPDEETALPKSSGLIGKKVSHYRLLQVIGGGGMGLVYEAEDLKLGRRVALKFLPEELAGDPIALQRFEREAKTASSLNHPNICTIHSVEEHEGQPFIDMELLEGQTLRDRLAGAGAGKGLGLDELLTLAKQIADALQAAHEKGIVHRDVKPANIFLSNKGVVNVLDFGLAKLLAASVADEVEVGSQLSSVADAQAAVMHLTRTGAAMGTAGYMSPEQVRGEKLDARADIFSFGLVMYEMATGQRAFTGDTAAAVQNAILTQPALPVRELNSGIPSQLSDIIQKSLEKNRDQRYQSAAELRAALQLVSLSARRVRRPALQWIAAAALVVLAMGGWQKWRSRTALKLTSDDTIVLAAFTNLTPDPVLNESLDPATEVALGQTPFLNPLLPDKVSQILTAMGKRADERLVPALAREVCLRTNSAAYVAGSVSDLGNQYRIQLDALDCKTGRAVKTALATADERIQIVRALGDAATSLRDQLGEPQTSRLQFNQPLQQATTSSLEALQAFSAGRTHYGKPEAVAEFERAVELDPNFALVYRWLGSCYSNLIRRDLEVENYTKAYQLRARTTLRDQLDTEATYYISVTGELDKAMATLERGTHDFPRAVRFRSNLGFVLRLLGQYERSVDVEREVLRAVPDQMSPYGNLAFAYIALGRLGDAKQVLDQAYAHHLDVWNLRWGSYRIAFLQRDQEGMDAQIRWVQDKPSVADFILREQSLTEAYYGRLHKADELMEQSVKAAGSAGAAERGAEWNAIAALRAAKVGERTLARELAAKALAMNPNRRAKCIAGLAFARAGDARRALTVEQELNRDNPLNTVIQGRELPTLLAAIDIQQGRARNAIEVLQPAEKYDLSSSEDFGMEPAYVRGEAYMQAGQAQLAAAQFRKMLAHPAILANSINAPLALLQLARAEAMVGDKASAQTAYQEFLALWKNADPDIPIYRQAIVEYAKLK